jgi:hypothetical protein
MARKRAKILPNPEAARTATREPVVIPGTCRIGERPAEDVLVLDIGANGCRLRGNSLGVTKSEPVELRIGDIGPVAAKLRWVKKGSLGVKFDAPIGDEALQKLYDTPWPAPNVVPLRRRSAA